MLARRTCAGKGKNIPGAARESKRYFVMAGRPVESLPAPIPTGGTMSVTAIVGGRVVPVDGEPIESGTVLIEDGKISAVGGRTWRCRRAPRSSTRPASGCCPASSTRTATSACTRRREGWAGKDTNEMTEPVTAARPRALDAINPADAGLPRRDHRRRARRSTSTPAPATRSAARPSRSSAGAGTVDEMVLREPSGMKSALGENPKRVYGEQEEDAVAPGSARPP